MEVCDVCRPDQLEACSSISSHRKQECYSHIIVVSSQDRDWLQRRLLCLNKLIWEGRQRHVDCKGIRLRWTAVVCERLCSGHIYIYWLIGFVVRVFANGPGDLASIPGCVIPKTLKMVLNTSLLNTQQYKVRIKGKVEQSRERSSALPYTSV